MGFNGPAGGYVQRAAYYGLGNKVEFLALCDLSIRDTAKSVTGCPTQYERNRWAVQFRLNVTALKAGQVGN
jgi:hypothetical protein